MFHAQSQNHSNPPQIRQSIIHDFAVRQIDDPDRPVEALMADPWAEWSPEVRALPDCLDVEPEVQLGPRLWAVAGMMHSELLSSPRPAARHLPLIQSGVQACQWLLVPYDLHGAGTM